MNFQEFEEVFRQIVRSERHLRGKWLTPLYSSSSLYTLSETSGETPPYIPVSPFQRVFISNERFRIPAGFYQCGISGDEMNRYIESLTQRGYTISGYHITGPDNRDLSSSGFPEISDLITSMLRNDHSLSADRVTFVRDNDRLTLDSRLRIHLSNYNTDLQPVFDLLRMHEGAVQKQRNAYENLSTLRISEEFPASENASSISTMNKPYLPGYEIVFTTMKLADSLAYSIHEIGNPLNWVRILKAESGIRFVRGIHCSFDFFTSIFQIYGGIRI